MWGYKELDVLVVRAIPELGSPWRVIKELFLDQGQVQYVMGENFSSEEEAKKEVLRLGPGWRAVPDANPSHDLNDAFRVLDALAHRAEVEEASLTWRRNRGWSLCFEGEPCGCVQSESLCEAICQGALFVAGVERE